MKKIIDIRDASIAYKVEVKSVLKIPVSET